MFSFPQRKTRLVFCFALGGWVSAFLGCAPNAKPISTGAASYKEAITVAEPEPAKTPAPAPVLVPSSPRVMNFVAAPKPTSDEWVYRKSGSKQPPLSLFEESALLGQVRATLKKLSDGENVKSVKVRNRTALLAVSSGVNSASARRIGEAVLNQTRIEEVRLKPAL